MEVVTVHPEWRQEPVYLTLTGNILPGDSVDSKPELTWYDVLCQGLKAIGQVVVDSARDHSL